MERDSNRATLLFPLTSDFNLGEAGAVLRAWDWQVWAGGRCADLPDRIEQDSENGEVRIEFGNWAIRIGRHEKVSRGVRAVIETDLEPEEHSLSRKHFPTEEAWQEFLTSTPNYFSFFESCLNALLIRFPEAVAFHHCGESDDVGSDGVWWKSDYHRDAPAPQPVHIVGWLARARIDEQDTLFQATVRCPCGSERVEVHYPGRTHPPNGRDDPIPCTVQLPGLTGYDGYWFGLKAVCAVCRQERVLFDSKLHGWDAVVAFSAAAKAQARALPRPSLAPWMCRSCGATGQSCEIRLRLQSPEGFLSETLEDTGWPMPLNQRVDAFVGCP